MDIAHSPRANKSQVKMTGTSCEYLIKYSLGFTHPTKMKPQRNRYSSLLFRGRDQKLNFCSVI